jgi:hypothetical protein
MRRYHCSPPSCRPLGLSMFSDCQCSVCLALCLSVSLCLSIRLLTRRAPQEQRKCQQLERKRAEELQRWHQMQSNSRFGLLTKTLNDLCARRDHTLEGENSPTGTPSLKELSSPVLTMLSLSSDDLCKLLLAETQASKDFKQGHASTTTELKEVDELVLKLQSTQDAIRDLCVKKVRNSLQ